jgi:hypothetical protein
VHTRLEPRAGLSESPLLLSESHSSSRPTRQKNNL